jgi:hypothetical protein
MNFSSVIAPIKAHPYVVGGGVAALVLLMYMRKTPSAQPAAAAPSTTQTAAADPNLVALQAAQLSANTQTSIASIQAQTSATAIQAAQQTAIVTSNNATIQNTTNDATAAFSTLSAGLSQNYSTQLAANSGGNYGNTTSGIADGTLITPGGAGWQPWMQNYIHSGDPVAIMGQDNYSPAASSVMNTANTQLEQAFNNIIRAGQGASPLETQIITSGNTGGPQQIGTAAIDPVLVNYDATGVSTINDITPTAGSTYGYTGSVYNQKTGASTIMK